MNRTARYAKSMVIALGISSMAVLSACGGGAGGIEAQELPQADEPGTSTAEFTPTPGNGLDIVLSDDTGAGVSDDYINAQWQYMQTCLEVSAQEPVVSVIDSQVEPVDAADDVIRHIDGQILASSHVTDVSAAIQVHARDFDGSVGNVGHSLRSIMGRYVWLANNLDERSYPYSCANDG